MHVYVKPCEMLYVTSFFLAELFRAIAESSSNKKTSHFPRQLKEDLEALLSVREIVLVQKLNGEMLKTSNYSKFLLIINSNRRHVCY